MDLERAFTYIWKDPDWIRKLAIGGLLAISGIGGIALFGWLAEMSRRVANQEDEILPEWHPFGDYILNGLKFIGVVLIWCLPVIVLTIIFAVIPAGMMIAIPESDQGIAIATISIFTACFSGFFMLYILAINLLTPTLWVPVAEGTSFNEILNPKLAWKIFRSNAGGFLVAMLLGILISSIFSLVGVTLFVIGTFLTSVVAQLILAHLIGQATQQAREPDAMTA